MSEPPDVHTTELEPGHCPVCGPRNDDAIHVRIGEWTYRRCATCETLYLDPRPTESAMADFYASEAYYQSDEERGGYQTYERDRPFYLRTYTKRLRRIAAHLGAGARVLDVGSGHGYMLEAIEQHGYEAWALDVPGAALRRCAELVGERAVPLPESSGRFESEFFDAITLFDVFEHLYDPERALRQYRDWLRPGGVLMMTTPDCHSRLARMSGSKWVSYKPPEHVFLYNRRSLIQVASRHFELVNAKSATQDVSLEFLADRVGRLSRPVGGAIGVFARLPGLRRIGVPVTSGSVTYVGVKNRSHAGGAT